MVFFILIVAVLNLGLGFAVAWQLGRRYRELLVLAVESAVPPGTPAAWEEPLSESTEGEDAAATSPADPSLDQEEVAQAGESPEADADPDSPLSQEEAATAHFTSEVSQYHQKLKGLDTSLRDCTVAPDPATVRSCADSLREANHDYRASREQAQQTFLDVHNLEEAFQGLDEELMAIAARQDAQIDETDNVIRDLDCEAAPDAACRQIVQETSKLLEVNHQLRDTLDEAAVVTARRDGQLGAIETSRLTDPLTELSNRAGLEACLADWWEKDPHRVRQLNAAMIDVDEFARVNERHGPQVGDQVLRAMASILTTESRNHLLAARYSGQRFVLLFPDVDLRFATNLVERIRQTLELTNLKYRDEDIRLTVSCAVTEIGHEDTSESLYTRSETTLHEAKRYGRNRTFVYEGRYPTPVVPPNFSLEEKSVAV